MKKNEITINIIGASGVGKTTVSLLISEALSSTGFSTTLVNPDFITKRHLTDYSNFQQEARIMSVLNKTENIIITETNIGKKMIKK